MACVSNARFKSVLLLARPSAATKQRPIPPLHHVVPRFPLLKLKQTGDAPCRHHHRYGPPGGEIDALATTNGARRSYSGRRMPAAANGLESFVATTSPDLS